MNAFTIHVKLDTAQLDKIAAGLNGNTDQVLGIVANKVLTGAIVNAPVDTGALMNSLHTEHPGQGSWLVADGVEYGIYQELGTWKMAAHPFMTPAVHAAEDLLNSGALWKRIFE
jgi:hypothetical protein